MAEANEGQGPDAPMETAGSVSGGLVSHIEGMVIVVEPLQSVLFAEGSKRSRGLSCSAFPGGDQGQVRRVTPPPFFFFLAKCYAVMGLSSNE